MLRADSRAAAVVEVENNEPRKMKVWQIRRMRVVDQEGVMFSSLSN